MWKTYLIQYQLPEEAPEWKVIKGTSQDDAFKVLRSELKEELLAYGVDRDEVDNLLLDISILEIEEK
jgi:hypothetical protein